MTRQPSPPSRRDHASSREGGKIAESGLSRADMCTLDHEFCSYTPQMALRGNTGDSSLREEAGSLSETTSPPSHPSPRAQV